MILTLGLIIAYLGIGAFLAKLDIPASWERAREENSYGLNGPFWDRQRKQFVRGAMASMFFFWPVKLSVRYITRLLDSAAVQADPRERERKLESEAREARAKELEQQRYIKKLEKELGISD